MNKQELIEKAVVDLNGEWPTASAMHYGLNIKRDKLFDASTIACQTICTIEEFNAAADRMRGKPDWKDAPDWACWLAQSNDGRWHWYPYCVDEPTMSSKCFMNKARALCAVASEGRMIGDWRNTLEKRPKQKADPLNGYEWGKEYPTNGKRPDLDDDVVVELKQDDGIWSPYGPDELSGWHWDHSIAFRIVDERYKPEPAAAPAKPWFEAGEFPPAGTECEVLTCGVWYKTKIVGMNDKMCVYVSKEFELVPYNGDSEPENFRPIKTERERFIDAAVAASDSFGVTWVADTAGLLFDAGFRAPDQK